MSAVRAETSLPLGPSPSTHVRTGVTPPVQSWQPGEGPDMPGRGEQMMRRTSPFKGVGIVLKVDGHMDKEPTAPLGTSERAAIESLLVLHYVL